MTTDVAMTQGEVRVPNAADCLSRKAGDPVPELAKHRFGRFAGYSRARQA